MNTLLNSLITELRRGTLTLAVLSQLRTPQYGYSLVQLLEQSGITIDQSTLYPLLRRLEKQELVTSSWDTSESRPRKYYVLSEYGVEIFIQLKKEWIKNSKELYGLLKGEEEDEKQFD
jgi:DNA-binding PadR family transcriptional regulator